MNELTADVRREAYIDAVRAATEWADAYGVGYAAVLSATLSTTMGHAAAHGTELAYEVGAAPWARRIGAVASVPWSALGGVARLTAISAAEAESHEIHAERLRIAREVHRPTRADSRPPRGPRSERAC